MLSTSREFLGLRSDLINGPTQPHQVDDNIPVCAGKRPVTFAGVLFSCIETDFMKIPPGQTKFFETQITGSTVQTLRQHLRRQLARIIHGGAVKGLVSVD